MPINGFEEITENLTEYEKETLLPALVRGFAGKNGVKQAVTNSFICKKLNFIGLKAKEARVRKLVNHIRVNNLVPGLIATSKGYYVSNDPTEILKYIDSLKQRENEIARVRQSFEQHVKTLMK